MNKQVAPIFLVFKFLKPYKARIFAGLISLLLVVTCMLLIGFAIKHFIDNGFGNNPNQDSILQILFLISIFGIASFFRSYIINSTAESAANDVKKKAYETLINLSSKDIDRFNFSDLSTRINSDSEYIARVVIDSTSFFLRNALTTLGGVFLMFLNSPKLSSITFVVIAVISLIATSISRKVRLLAKNAENAKSKTSNLVLETIINYKVLNASSKQSALNKYFLNLNEDAKSKVIERLRFRSFFFAIVITSMLLVIAIIVWLGSKEVVSGSMSSGTLASFLFYAFMTATSFGGIMEMLNDQQKNLANCERVFDVIALPIQNMEISNSNFIVLPKQGDIELRNISYNYEESENIKIISDLNFKFKIGKFNIITGTSGVGKTTLLNLIMGLYNFTNGEIIIGNNSYKYLSPLMWNKKLSYVPQDSMLFSGSIIENITFFESEVSLEKINAIINGLALVEFIQNLPKGLDTDIGSLATKISGGQKQRIAIARALLNNPELLVLDEATSQLDEITEAEVLDFIKKTMKNKTIICVAHRRGAIDKGDSIINLS